MTRTTTPAVEAAVRAGLEFHMLQHIDELIMLVDWLEQVGVRLATVLEIGSYTGGSTAFFCTLATERVVSIDLPDAVGCGPTMLQSYQRNHALATRFPHFRGIIGDSHDSETFVSVKSALDGRPVDLLFIDGDHSELGVTSDCAMYGALVRPGGVIAFHDIATTLDPRCEGIVAFWNKLGGPKVEFHIEATWGGIGALQCPTA